MAAIVVGEFYLHTHEGHRRAVITFNMAIDRSRVQAAIDQHIPAQRGRRSTLQAEFIDSKTVVLTDTLDKLKPSDMLERARGVITKCGAKPQVVQPPTPPRQR